MEQREGGKAGGCSRGIRAALMAPPPGHLVLRPLPERSGMQAVEERLMAIASSPSTPPTMGKCLSPYLAHG